MKRQNWSNHEPEMNLIRHLVWSFHRTTGLEWEELFGEAQLAYCQALRSYDNAHGKKLTSWAYTCIVNHLKTYIQKQNGSHTISLDALLSNKDFQNRESDGEAPIPEVLYDYEMEQITDLFGAMGPKARTVCDLIFESPDMFEENTVMKLQGILRDLGWKWIDIWAAFKNIRFALNSLN